ncbi:ABC transporter ATP-binding protein [Lachnospiraceae bacterium WCA-693-APC-MOT-I]|uniref:ABC transporter ATP-binding protein n=2 Tax=Velocimicrobium porci TaxID=2606634 RepID=A0A6L5XV75_9FIRM|nr:ABC transporter ATP-binding protein [Velocimicrobium porci]
MEKNKKVKIKDIILSLRQIPKTMKLIWKIDKKLITEILILSIITGIFPLLSLLLSQELINSIAGLEKGMRYVIWIFILYMTIGMIGELISQVYEYMEGKFQFILQFRLHYMVMEKCSSLSLKEFETPEVYDKIEKITGEIAYKPYQIFSALLGTVSSVVTMVSSAVFLFVWNPYLSGLLLLVPILSLFYFLKIGQQEFEMMWNRAKEERKTWYLSYLLTHDFSFKEISLFHLKPYLLEKYWKLSKHFIKQNQNILRLKTIFHVIYECVMQAINFVIIGTAIMQAYIGKILVGNVVSYIRSVGLVQSHSQAVMSNIYAIYNSTLYMDMLFQFLEEEEKKKKAVKTKSIPDDITEIEIKNLSFSYSGKENVLKDINLTIKKGEKIALVGPNGSGKSTLLKVLAGLYEISSGNIYLDGVSIKNIDLEEYQGKLSVLFQDFVKYEMTLRENIGFGYLKEIENDSRIKQILEHTKLEFLKQGNDYDLDIQLGNWFENGRQLSQGQWQKIALCRAYFREASVYILDEPNAALDTVAEKEVFEKFFELSNEKIGVFISHRLNAAKMADKIIVLDKGKIVGVGTHQELLKNCPVYEVLYESENYECLRGE